MKRLLLDTHTLLWWLIDDACLGANAKRQIADPGNAVYVSAASIWEDLDQTGAGQAGAAGRHLCDHRGRRFSGAADGRLSLPTGRAAATLSSGSFRSHADRTGAGRGAHADLRRRGVSAVRRAGGGRPPLSRFFLAFAAHPFDMNGQEHHLFRGELMLIVLFDVAVDLAGAGE